MSASISYASKYYARWRDNEGGYDYLIAKDSFAERWDRPSCMPDVVVTHELSCAFFCLYAGDRRRAEVFLSRAVRNADRLEAEDRFHDDVFADIQFPSTLATVIRDRAYAKWLLGDPLDRVSMRVAAEHFATWCLTKPEDRKHFVSPVTMNDYLAGVRTAIVAGDLDYAAKLVKTKHKFLWHHETERALWERFVPAYPEIGDTLAKEFEAFFDRIRDPDFDDAVDGVSTGVNRETLRLDAAVIRQMYVVNRSPSEPVDPEAVVKAIAR